MIIPLETLDLAAAQIEEARGERQHRRDNPPVTATIRQIRLFTSAELEQKSVESTVKTRFVKPKKPGTGACKRFAAN